MNFCKLCGTPLDRETGKKYLEDCKCVPEFVCEGCKDDLEPLIDDDGYLVKEWKEVA